MLCLRLRIGLFINFLLWVLGLLVCVDSFVVVFWCFLCLVCICLWLIVVSLFVVVNCFNALRNVLCSVALMIVLFAVWVL